MINNTDLLPYIYNVTLHGSGDDENIYLLAEVKGSSNLTGDTAIAYFLDNNDYLVMHRGVTDTRNTDLFEDRFVSWNTTQNDIYFRGTKDGAAAISFSNGTKIFEISHPLCSKDSLHDVCIDPDKRIDLTFLLGTSDDFNTNQLLFSVGSGFSIFSRGEGDSLVTGLVSPANFVLEILARSSVQERTEYLNLSQKKKVRNF